MTRQWMELLALTCCLLLAANARAKEDAAKPQVNIPALIDRLAEIGDSDYGYSPYVTGSVFTPLDREGRFHAGLLFQKPAVQSDVMRELVRQGATAIPQLLEHLGDKRKTRIRISNEGGFSTLFVTEDEDAQKKNQLFGGRGVTLRIGDLCYVAVGQIVNRPYNAARYQPTAIVYVNSPVRSTELRKQIQDEWNGLTPQKHRGSLLDDLNSAEHLDSGACKRLAYYYPDALEKPVLKILAEPTYDASAVRQFVREDLYVAKTPKAAKELFESFVAKRGNAYRFGIMHQLYDDLERLEANEENRVHPPLKEFGEQPRKLLTQLYAKDEKVRSKDRPKSAKPHSAWTTSEVADFIERGLIYDDSAKIDAAVQKILVATKDDEVALACMKRLVGRGFDVDIENYIRKRSPDKYYDEAFNEVMKRVGWSRLHVAVERNQTDWVERWIALGQDVNVRGVTGNTPLHIAALGGNAKVAQLLLAAKADVDARNRDGQTAVELAVAGDHLEVAKYLLERGCAVADVLVGGLAGRVDLLESLLKTDRSCLQKTTRSKWTALHLAAWAGEAKAVTFLLDKGANVNAADENDYTPLHLAASQGHDETVRLLLANRADAGAKTKRSGLEPLHLAALAGKEGVAKTLIAHGASLKATISGTNMTVMHLSARAGHADLLALFHSKGLSVDVRDETEMTPLHHAAEFGQKSCVQFLIEKKADMNAKSKREHNPMHLAVKGGHLDVVVLLLEHKAVISSEGSFFGGSPLQIAESHEEPEIAGLLRKHGAKK